ncbi:histone-lysine n-methyltransferase atxr3 [Hordeum vulgare]|nr:histone-lysine n-methyltransferase atxr3 [Hordeum vulgare]
MGVLDTILPLCVAGDVAVPELEMMNVKEEVKEEVLEEQPVPASHLGLVGQRWSWLCTATDMADAVGAGSWYHAPPRSPEREPSPWEEVVQARSTFHGPPSHLWTPPPYIHLTGDEDDNDDT